MAFGIKIIDVQQGDKDEILVNISFRGVNKPGVFIGIMQLLIGVNFTEAWTFLGKLATSLFRSK